MYMFIYMFILGKYGVIDGSRKWRGWRGGISVDCFISFD